MGVLPIRGNWLGLGMFVVVGGLVALIGGFILKLGDVKTMITVGAALAVADLAIRIVNRTVPGWIFSREAGGYFFFIPIWILGLLVVVLKSLIGAGVIKK